MKKSFLMFLVGMFIACAITFNSNLESYRGLNQTLSLKKMVAISFAFGENGGGATVRKPKAVLCPSKTKYKTECEGSGDGCDPTDC